MENLDKALNLRITATDLGRLDALLEAIPVFGNRNAVARAAILLGLEALEQDPTLLVKAAIRKRGRKPRKS